MNKNITNCAFYYKLRNNITIFTRKRKKPKLIYNIIIHISQWHDYIAFSITPKLTHTQTQHPLKQFAVSKIRMDKI